MCEYYMTSLDQIRWFRRCVGDACDWQERPSVWMIYHTINRGTRWAHVKEINVRSEKSDWATASARGPFTDIVGFVYANVICGGQSIMSGR